MVHFIFIPPTHWFVTDVLVYNLHMTIFSRVYLYVTRAYSYVIRMLLVCYSYVTRMYSCVTRMLLVCTRMLLARTRVYSHVTRMYSYVTRMLLVCSFSHNLKKWLFILCCIKKGNWFHHLRLGQYIYHIILLK